jgi:5'-nucleotidase
LKILVTNDDGIYSTGIEYLKKALETIAEVVVIAPDTEKSGIGHAITLSDPLRVTEIKKNGGFFGYAVNGTPADCVKIGVRCIMETPPDIVAAGINLGPNTATNILYSGTVSAAAEGIIMGVPSFAISITTFHIPEYEYAAKFAVQIAKKIYKNGLADGTLLNINLPPLKEEEIEGVVITRQGKGRFQESFEKRIDPFNRKYYWLAGKRMDLDSESDIDDVVVTKNKVSVTPVRYDLTDQKMLGELKKWNISK